MRRAAFGEREETTTKRASFVSEYFNFELCAATRPESRGLHSTRARHLQHKQTNLFPRIDHNQCARLLKLFRWPLFFLARPSRRRVVIVSAGRSTKAPAQDEIQFDLRNPIFNPTRQSPAELLPRVRPKSK